MIFYCFVFFTFRDRHFRSTTPQEDGCATIVHDIKHIEGIM